MPGSPAEIALEGVAPKGPQMVAGERKPPVASNDDPEPRRGDRMTVPDVVGSPLRGVACAPQPTPPARLLEAAFAFIPGEPGFIRGCLVPPSRRLLRRRSITAARLYCLLPGPYCLFLHAIHLSRPTGGLPRGGHPRRVATPPEPNGPGGLHPGPSTGPGATMRRALRPGLRAFGPSARSGLASGEPSTLTPRAAFLRAKPSPKRPRPP